MAIPKLIFILISILAIYSITIQVSALGGTKVGARTKITDVKTNKEIQDLGKYCVEEYNRRQSKEQDPRVNGSKSKLLMFTQVIEAEKQVVSGTKYYLKISASNGNGVPKIFDAVIVVKSWMKTSSRDLVGFTPSPPSS